ncbi:AI-2E family transporter, partial [Clostridium neonatale]
SFGILFTYATALVVVFLFIKFVLPQVVDSISGLINDIPSYINETNKFIDGTLAKLNIDQQYLRIINENFNDLVNYIIKVATNFLPLLGGMLTTVASSIWNIILGI